MEQESIEDKWEQHSGQGNSRCEGSVLGGVRVVRGCWGAGVEGGTWLEDDDDFNKNKHCFQDKLVVLFSLYRKGAGLCS